jgi:hypothetical protein
MTPEGYVKAKVKKVLKPYIDSGVLYGDWPVPSGYGKSGLDFHGCINGWYFAVETKKPGGKPTALQDVTIERIMRAGGSVFVIDGQEDLAMLDAWLTLRGIGWRP